MNFMLRRGNNDRNELKKHRQRGIADPQEPAEARASYLGILVPLSASWHYGALTEVWKVCRIGQITPDEKEHQAHGEAA